MFQEFLSNSHYLSLSLSLSLFVYLFARDKIIRFVEPSDIFKQSILL